MIKPLPAIAPLAFTADLRANGVQSRTIAAAIEGGDLIKVAPGIVVTPDLFVHEDLQLALACHRTGGTVGMLTAAARHGLCDAVPPQVDVFVRHADVRNPPADLPVRIIRTRNELTLTQGVDEFDLHGLRWRMTTPARTVVDLYRIAPDAHRQHAVAALATYLGDGGDQRELRRCAKQFDAWDALRAEVEAITESYQRGM